MKTLLSVRAWHAHARTSSFAGRLLHRAARNGRGGESAARRGAFCESQGYIDQDRERGRPRPDKVGHDHHDHDGDDGQEGDHGGSGEDRLWHGMLCALGTVWWRKTRMVPGSSSLSLARSLSVGLSVHCMTT